LITDLFLKIVTFDNLGDKERKVKIYIYFLFK